MIIRRRQFLIGLAAGICAPAIVRPASLMRVVSMLPAPLYVRDNGSWIPLAPLADLPPWAPRSTPAVAASEPRIRFLTADQRMTETAHIAIEGRGRRWYGGS